MAFDFLEKEHTIAKPGFNRWLVPPAALAIHLCIGMAYGFSVFWLPLSRALGIKESIACAPDAGFMAQVMSTSCDWKISMLGWMYTMFFVLLGISAAIWGGWLERAGPRKAGVVAAFCWCGGLLISAFGVYSHQIWLMWLGSGVIGGIGLGLGYISPVSTLIKWFPDRRGMATGMAIMGFGGGALVGSPLADKLMKHFATPTSVGVWETFVVMAIIYFVFMMAGAFGYRVPPSGWKPTGWTPPAANNNTMITQHHVHVSKVWGIPQVLADMAGAVPECVGRDRRDRDCFAHVAGSCLAGIVLRGRRRSSVICRMEQKAGDCPRLLPGLYRADQSVQYWRPFRLGLLFRLFRPQDDLLHLLRARLHLVRQPAMVGQVGQHRLVRRRRLSDPVDVRWRFCHGAGLSGRPVRDPDGGGDSRSVCSPHGPPPVFSARWW